MQRSQVMETVSINLREICQTKLQPIRKHNVVNVNLGKKVVPFLQRKAGVAGGVQPGDFIEAFQYLKGAYKQEGE